MTLRSRTRSINQHGDRNGVIRNRLISYEECVDVKDEPWRDHLLNSVSVKIEGSVENGRINSGIFTNYPSRLVYTNYPFPSFVWPQSEASMYSAMAAATAPLRPEISLPTFLAELKDWGDMARDVRNGLRFASALHRKFNSGKGPGGWSPPPVSPDWVLNQLKDTSLPTSLSRAKKLARANLAIQLGWAPFVSDLLTMANFMSAVERRRREVAQLANRKVMTRRWKGPTITQPTFVDVRTLGEDGYGGVRVTVSCSARRWAVIKWYTGHNTALPESDADLIRDMLGLHPRAILPTLWEIIPFSFVADYFSNIGQIVNSAANGMQFDSVGCVMTNITLNAEHGSYKTVALPLRDINLSAGSLRREWKIRSVFDGTPGLLLFDHLLGSKQLSILGSLSLARGR